MDVGQAASIGERLERLGFLQGPAQIHANRQDEESKDEGQPPAPGVHLVLAQKSR